MDLAKSRRHQIQISTKAAANQNCVLTLKIFMIKRTYNNTILKKLSRAVKLDDKFVELSRQKDELFIFGGSTENSASHHLTSLTFRALP